MAHQGIRVGRRGWVEESRRPCNICAAFPGPPLGPAKEVRTMSHRDDGTMTRRGFLIITGAAVSVALQPRRAATQQAAPPAPPVPGKERLIVRSPRPINLETGLADLTSYHTPEELFFVRNNYDAAPVDPVLWTLKIEGEINNPVLLRLDDLKKLPMFTQDVTLECAGNGRAFHKPRASGIQWEYGAVGTQAWRGVRLADVLALAKPRASAQHVAFDGADTPPTPQAPDFIRSVPMWKALERHTMIALEMGGKPVPRRGTVGGGAGGGGGEPPGTAAPPAGARGGTRGRSGGRGPPSRGGKGKYDGAPPAGTRPLRARPPDTPGRAQPASRAWNRL